MTIKHVFIAGVAKCGTTALSEWMVVNGLAEDRVPGEKEPYLYANDEPHAARGLSRCVRIDTMKNSPVPGPRPANRA